MTWQTVSDVTNPPIDFHSMTMGDNPDIIYGASGMGTTPMQLVMKAKQGLHPTPLMEKKYLR